MNRYFKYILLVNIIVFGSISTYASEHVISVDLDVSMNADVTYSYMDRPSRTERLSGERSKRVNTAMGPINKSQKINLQVSEDNPQRTSMNLSLKLTSDSNHPWMKNYQKVIADAEDARKQIAEIQSEDNNQDNSKSKIIKKLNDIVQVADSQLKDPLYKLYDESITVRSIGTDAKVMSSGDTTTYALDLNDNQPFLQNSGKHRWDYGSSFALFDFNNPQVTGKIRIKYKVPDNTYLLKVRRQSSSGALNLVNANIEVDGVKTVGLVNSLDRLDDGGQLNQDIYVWVKPGVTVEQLFQYQEFTNTMTGRFSMSITPIHGVKYSNSQMFNKIIEHVSNHAETLKGGGTIRDEIVIESFNALAKILGEKSNLQTLVDNMSLDQIRAVIDNLQFIRDASGDAVFLDAKYASVIFAAKLSALYLKNLTPYCAIDEFELAYQNTVVKTRWLNIARFLLSKISIRLENYSVTDVEALLSEAKKFQDEGRTYAEVRASEDYIALRKSMQLVINTAGLRETPLTNAYAELSYLVSEVGQLGVSTEQQKVILNSVERASEYEASFKSGLVRFMREFHANNNKTVNLDRLKESMDNLMNEVSIAYDKVNSGIQIFAVTSTGVDRFTDVIVDLNANNLEILFQDMPNLNYFVKELRSNEGYEDIIAEANQCWKGDSND